MIELNHETVDKLQHRGIRAVYGDASQPLILEKAGADVVVTSEAEVAMAMAERLLRRLGATEEQLDRERERVRSELEPA